VGARVHSRAGESASVGVTFGLQLAYAFEYINNTGDRRE
jgi:hypothetical protein